MLKGATVARPGSGQGFYLESPVQQGFRCKMMPPTGKRRPRAPPSTLPARMLARAFTQPLATRTQLGTPGPQQR
jgi:hypothetical protein